MQTVHVIDLEKHHPGYIDRKLHWGKIHSKLFMNPKYNMWPEIDKCRYIAFICLELEMQEPIMLDPKFLTGIGFDLKKRPISLTLQVLHDYVEICNGNVTECTQSVVQSRVEESRVDKSIYDDFETFWKSYPRKVGKGKARESFLKIKPSKELLDKMISAVAVQNQTEQWQKEKGQYIPNPATWLNQERWSDEPQVKPSKQPAPACFIDHKPSVQCVDGLCLCVECFAGWQAMGKQFLWGSMSKAEIERIVEQGKARCQK